MAYLKFLAVVGLLYAVYYTIVYFLDNSGSKSSASGSEIDLGHLALAADPHPAPIHGSHLLNAMEAQLAAKRPSQEIPKEVIEGIENVRSISL